MTRRRHFTAVYERDPGSAAWLVSIDGLVGCQTYGRSLHEASARIVEALATWLDCEPAELAVTDRLPDDIAAVVRDVADKRSRAQAADEQARESTLAGARTLIDRGFSRRDAARVLGLSHQRIQQLLAG